MRFVLSLTPERMGVQMEPAKLMNIKVGFNKKEREKKKIREKRKKRSRQESKGRVGGIRCDVSHLVVKGNHTSQAGLGSGAPHN